MKKVKHPQFGKSVFLIATATFVVFGLILGSWVTVYAAQDSLPGDLLYPVKLAQEDMQLAFTSDTEARIRLLNSFVNQRAEEAAALASKGEPVPDELQTMTDSYLEELFILTSSEDDPTVGIQKRPRDQDQGMTNPMNGNANNAPDPDDLDQPQEMTKVGQEPPDSALPESTTLLADPLTEVNTIVSETYEISATQTITPGTYGPGPCVAPDCTAPLADEHSPGSYLGEPPGPENHEGYGPGFDQGQSAQQPPAEDPEQLPIDVGSDNANGQGGKP